MSWPNFKHSNEHVHAQKISPQDLDMKVHRATACPHITQDDLDKARTELALALEMPATRKQTFTHCGSNLLHWALTLDIDLDMKFEIKIIQNFHIWICIYVHTHASAAKGCRNHAAVRCHNVLCKVHCVSAYASSGSGPGAGCKFHQTQLQLNAQRSRYWHRRR